MRRPKDPSDTRGEDEVPPGGRARKRVDQFNRARGLTDGSEKAPDETGEDASKDAPPPKDPTT